MPQPMMVLIVQIVAILAVMYFLFMVPQAKARKKSEAMLAGIQKGNEVMTAGGIVGKVKDVRDTLVTIESGTAQIVVERSRIVRVGSQTSTAGPAI